MGVVVLGLAAIATVLGFVGVLAIRGPGPDGDGAPVEDTLPAGTPGADLVAAVVAGREAEAPFRGLTEVTLLLDGRCVRVVVADEPEERGRGLREVADLGPYAGMLFAYADDGERTFTMATVPIDLDVTYFDAGGARVGGTRMAACPDGGPECPTYPSGVAFRWALETPAGRAPQGPLRACPESAGATVTPPR